MQKQIICAKCHLSPVFIRDSRNSVLLMIPRKGTKTDGRTQIKRYHGLVLLMIPRKGTKTQKWYIEKPGWLGFINDSPQGDENCRR